MDLRSLAALFPSEPGAWAEPHSGAFPYDLRARFRVRLGGLFAAADRARPRAANRLGPATRAYEPGDAFKDLSLPLLARLGEYHTRVDNAPGRAMALVVVHLYPNMAYASPDAGVRKGQTALAVAALLECAHAGAMHGVRVLPCLEPDLPAFLAENERLVARSRWLWVLSDGLFEPRSADGGLAALTTALAPRPNLKTSLVLIRDPRELPSQSRESRSAPAAGSAGPRAQDPVVSALLRPFAPSGTPPRARQGEGVSENVPPASADSRFSGEDYERGLARQLEFLTAQASRLGFGRIVAWPGLGIEAFARDLGPHC